MHNTYTHIHFIGIGGISVSAGARFSASRGITVTGSDSAASTITAALEKEHIPVTVPHNVSAISEDVDLVVFSEAVPKDNIERVAAHERGIPEMTIFEFWGMQSAGKRVVAVSGTNGKSTTTALIGHLFEQAGLDPTVVVGTIVRDWNSNIRIGASPWFVIEADEYHDHMRALNPEIAVITNIEPDHLDYYKDVDDIVSHFDQWIAGMPAHAAIIVNNDDMRARALDCGDRTRVTFGSTPEADIRSASIVMRTGADGYTGETFCNIVDAVCDWKEVRIGLPGKHNIQNLIAAAAVARQAGISRSGIVRAAKTFGGTWRRFEHVGEYAGSRILSDYAHHPAGVRATIAAAREWYPDKRIVVLFQPHQHNRTKHLFDEFVASFDVCDELLISEIYDVAGRENPADRSVTSQDLVRAITDRAAARTRPHARLLPNHMHYAGDVHEAEQALRGMVKKGDIVLVMGAGDIDTVARAIIQQST